MAVLVPAEAERERDEQHGEGCELPAHGATSMVRRRRRRSAPSSGVSAPTIRAVSVAKYQPPVSTSAVAPSAIGRPSASRTTRSANAAANSVSCVATRTATPAAASARRRSARSPLTARSMPRVGSSRQTAAGGSRAPLTIPSASRRRPPPRAGGGGRLAPAPGGVARVGGGEPLEADGGERVGRGLVGDALVQQVV